MSARNAFLFPQISFANKCLWVSYRDPLRKVNTWMKLCFCGCIDQIITAFIYIWFRQSLRQTASVTGCFRGDVGVHSNSTSGHSDLKHGNPQQFSRVGGVCWHLRPQPNLCQLKVKNSRLNSYHRENNSHTLKKIIINSASTIISIGMKGIDNPHPQNII